MAEDVSDVKGNAWDVDRRWPRGYCIYLYFNNINLFRRNIPMDVNAFFYY